MKKLVIFDYDGVIADSEIVFHTIFIEELKKVGVEITSEELSRKFSGNSTTPFDKKIFEYCRVTLPESFYSETSKKVFDNAKKVKLNPNLTELLEKLTSRDIKYCIASGARREWVLKTMKILNIDGYFPNNKVFTSESVEKGKPSPDIFLHVLDRYDLNKDDCLIIEDSLNGLMAGLASGIKTIAYTGGSHITTEYMKDINKLYIEVVNNLLDVTKHL